MKPVNAERIPVIVGVGEITDRSEPANGLEPVALIEQALRRAEQDAGASLLQQIDSLDVVQLMSWGYLDVARLTAQKIGAAPARLINGPIGGETPVRLLTEAAARIASGESRIAAVCGGESLRSFIKNAEAGTPPDWSEPDPEHQLLRGEDHVSALAARYGLRNPVDVYPLYENACRAAWGQSIDAAQAESGAIWSAMSEVAAHYPYAWSPKAMTAEEIVTPSKNNRAVSYPYQKFMIAQIGVNQGAAVIVTSLAVARAAGIPEDRLVYVWAGAGADEPDDFLARDRYDHAPALDLVLRRTLEINAIQASDVQLYELYSCFPCVPKLSRRSLGLPVDMPVTTIGGLTFFGGPGNNYMTHAIAGMVRALRQGRGRLGLIHGNGAYVTKHYAAVLSLDPPPPSVTVRALDLQAEFDAAYAPVAPLLTEYQGPNRIETFMVKFDQNGKPESAVVIARTPAGDRVIGKVSKADDGDALAFLVKADQEPIGHAGFSYPGSDGLMHWGLDDRAGQLKAHQPEVLFEMLGDHIALVTLNRPAQRNAVNGAMSRLMTDYVNRIEADPEIRVAVLMGAGEQAFCAGMDLAEAAQGPEKAREVMGGPYGFAGFVNANKRRKPWIAAVRGFALGGGTELALACDLVVAGESARFGLPEVKRSLVAAAGGAYRLPRMIPPRIAMEMLLTGEAITAARALEIHLVNRVVADADLRDEAHKLAEAVAANAPLAVQESRLIASGYLDDRDKQLSERSVNAVLRLSRSADLVEGISAFMAKRLPKWKGR